MKFVIITGISGAGKSNAVKFMEDLGYFCVDNLPPALIPKFAEICMQSDGKFDKIALVMDVRGGILLKDFFPGVEFLRNAGITYEIMFLEASDDVLVKRYKESRRTPPLSKQGRISSGISEERKMLEKIKLNAHHVIDTSSITTKQLRETISRIFNENKKTEGLSINIITFGFKYGIPADADLVFDVRFIPNPFYIDSMKHLTGKDGSVIEYVLNNDLTQEFLKRTFYLLEFLVPNYIKEGKSQLILAVGCTGGRHRSVAIGNKLCEMLKTTGSVMFIEHKDIERDPQNNK